MTRTRAEAVVRELVKAGEVSREQASERVDELVARGRRMTDSLVEAVRKEVARQLATMGVVTRDDLAALEARLQARIDKAAPGTPPAKKPPAPRKRAAD